MTLDLPECSLVVLIGVSSSGKSTFAQTHFKATEVVSSDYCRAVVSDDENDQSATKDAFELVHSIVGKRLQRGLLTVIDATNVKAADRKSYLELARQYHALPVAIVFNMPERVLKDRHHARTDRDFPEQVLIRQFKNLRESTQDLTGEGFRYVYEFTSPERMGEVTINRTPLLPDRKTETGPFDLIGDMHGCYDELVDLLTILGYQVHSPDPLPEEKREKEQPIASAKKTWIDVIPPPGRKAVFVGDLVDRGPDSPAVLKLVMAMVRQGTALCVPGNHDDKLLRKLRGRDVKLNHGLAETLKQLSAQPPEFVADVRQFLDGLISHYVLDGGRLVVAHAGLREEMQGRGSGAVLAFCLYGETTGEIDEFGLPVRYNWASEYKGRAMVVYGHTPVPEAEWLNNTIDIDTGCVFGGKLTALRYPERELVSVPARRIYAEPARPFQPNKDTRL